MKKHIQEQLANEPKHTLRNIIIAVIVITAIVWSGSVFKVPEILERGSQVAISILSAIVNPNPRFLWGMDTSGVPYLMLETIAIAFLGTIIGAILAIPFAFLSSKNIIPKKWHLPGVFSITLIRTLPVFVLGIMFITVTGPGPFAGVLTMAISSIGMMSKLYIEAIEDLDRGILEALDSIGCNTYEKIRYGILPQLFTNFISTSIYRFEINVKNASILGLVGAGGIGFPLLQAMGNNRWNDAGAYLLGLIVVVIIVEYASTRIRKKLAYG